MKKKILSALLCFVFLVQTVAVGAASYDFVNFEDKLYDDGVDEANGKIYYVAGANTISRKIKFSMDMGLIEEFAPNASVTKQNIKDALHLLFGYDDFYDSYYKAAEDDELLKVDEAIVLFMDAAGYGKYLELNGRKNLSHYRSEATRKGLLDDLEYTSAKKMFTAEMFYTMLYNALNMPMFSGTVYTDDRVDYGFTEATLMNTSMGLIRISGVVKANSYTSINGVEPVGENRIDIANTIYKYEGLKDVDSFLGYTVEAYIDRNNMLRAIAVNELKNETKIFDDSIEVKNTTTRTDFQYYFESNRLKSLSLNPYINVVYNNVACPDFRVRDYNITNGYIKFIDNNNDNVYDVAFVNEYYSFMPYIVYDSKYIIEDIMGNAYDLEKMITGGAYRGMYDTEGEAVDISQININTPISVLTAYGTREVTELIFLDENTYEGVYSGSKQNPVRYKIGDQEFKTTKYFMDRANGQFPHKLGSRIIIYLDQFGKIIKSAYVEDVVKFGWVTGIASDDEAFNTAVRIKMFTENDKWEIFDFAKSFTCNDRRVTAQSVLTGGATEIYTGGAAVPQLVKYRTNAKGMLIEIETAVDKSGTPNSYNDTDEFQLNYKSNGNIKYYAGQIQAFNGKYRMNKAATKVFNIPTDPKYVDHYRMGVDEIYNDNLYNVDCYDVDINYTSSAIVIHRGAPSSYVGGASGTGKFVIETGQALYKATDEVLDYVAGAAYDWETSEYADPDVFDKTAKDSGVSLGGRYSRVIKFTDLRRGDVYESVQNYDKRVVAFRVLLALDPQMPLEDQTFEVDTGDNKDSTDYKDLDWYGEDQLVFAKVVSRDMDSMVINANKESSFTNRDYNRLIVPENSQRATVYEIGKDKYRYGTFADVQVGDFVFVELNGANLKNLIVYRP